MLMLSFYMHIQIVHQCKWKLTSFAAFAGPKGFSLSSYGSGVSTVEPFLIDEKRITGKQVEFWVRKRLAAQGIIPVWSE